MNSLPVEGPLQGPAPELNPAKQPSSPIKELPLDLLPFADLSSCDIETMFSSKKAPMDEKLLKELEQLLQVTATQIEQSMQALEKTKQSQDPINTIIDVGSWAEYLNTFDAKKEEARLGVELLDQLLPYEILNKFPHFAKTENLISLGGAFISALNSGSEGVALICRTKILANSKLILEELRKSYHQKAASPTPEKAADLEKLKQTLLDWELNVKLEEKALAEAKRDFKLNASYNVLYFFTYPLDYFSTTSFLKYTKMITAGISWVMSGLELAYYALELKKSKKDTVTFKKWQNDYQEWQSQQLPKFKEGPKGLERMAMPPSSTPSYPTDEEHRAALFKIIDEAKDLDPLRKKLEAVGIALDPSLKTKEEFISLFQNNSLYQAKFVKTYLSHQRGLESFDFIVQTSKDLLAKRTAIIQKKILLLKPHFHTLEPKIKQQQKELFVRAMQDVLWEEMIKPNCSAQALNEVFTKWGFDRSSIVGRNHPLLQAVASFETMQKEKVKPALVERERERLINEFHTWLSDPKAMDALFQEWFSVQSQEDLLRSYVDHQQIIEQVTANALKEMVSKKHEIENKFINFKLTQSEVYLVLAVISLALSLTLAILGLLTIPLAGAGLILLYFSVGSTLIGYGFLGASHYQMSTEKPHTFETYTLKYQLKKSWAKLNASIQQYFHLAKEKKLCEVAKVLYNLKLDTKKSRQGEEEHQKALVDYYKAKAEFEQSEQKVNQWTKQIKTLDTELSEKGWADFAGQASLQLNEKSTAFDTLRAFREVIEAADVTLFSEETKRLLTRQLGIDIVALQGKLKNDPEAVKSTLQEFFILDDAGLVTFIRTQKARQKINLSAAA